jgi:hypothetical protein
MFADVQGAHGIPVVIGCMKYGRTLDVFTGLGDLGVCEDLTEMYSEGWEGGSMQSRALVRMICGTQGTSVGRLGDSPKKMAKAILDAMIGMIVGKLMVDVLM